MKSLDFAVDALAVARITRLVVDDEILDDFRNRVFERFHPQQSKIGYFLTCHACTSVWAAALVSSGLLPKQVRYMLALSELTVAVRESLDR